MKMRSGRAIKFRTAKESLPGCLPCWQRWLLGGYVALFAWVLPLICWGAMAEPGHPHRLPHFVFAMPVLVSSTAPMADPHKHHGAHHPTATATEDTSPVAAKELDGPVPGRSTPKLMIFSILMFVLLGAWLLNRLDLPHFALALCYPFPRSIVLAVPVRPPRLPGL